MCLLTPSFSISSRQNSLNLKRRIRLGTSCCCWRALASDVVVRSFLPAFDLAAAVRILLLDLDKLLLEARWGGEEEEPHYRRPRLSSKRAARNGISCFRLLFSVMMLTTRSKSKPSPTAHFGLAHSRVLNEAIYNSSQFRKMSVNCRLKYINKEFSFCFNKIKKHNFCNK